MSFKQLLSEMSSKSDSELASISAQASSGPQSPTAVAAQAAAIAARVRKPEPPKRRCNACRTAKLQEAFSDSMWHKAPGAVRICRECRDLSFADCLHQPAELIGVSRPCWLCSGSGRGAGDWSAEPCGACAVPGKGSLGRVLPCSLCSGGQRTETVTDSKTGRKIRAFCPRCSSTGYFGVPQEMLDGLKSPANFFTGPSEEELAAMKRRAERAERANKLEEQHRAENEAKARKETQLAVELAQRYSKMTPAEREAYRKAAAAEFNWPQELQQSNVIGSCTWKQLLQFREGKDDADCMAKPVPADDSLCGRSVKFEVSLRGGRKSSDGYFDTRVFNFYSSGHFSELNEFGDNSCLESAGGDFTVGVWRRAKDGSVWALRGNSDESNPILKMVLCSADFAWHATDKYFGQSFVMSNSYLGGVPRKARPFKME